MPELNELKTNIESIELTKEQLEDLLNSYYSDPILLDQDEIRNSDHFKLGKNEALEMCGMISTFMSIGVSQIDSVNLVVSILNAQTTLKCAEIAAEAAKSVPYIY